MQRRETKDRFLISRVLTYSIVLIMGLFFYKYAVIVYRLVMCDHVSVEIENGQSIADNILLATIFTFFGTLLYASLIFKVQPG